MRAVDRASVTGPASLIGISCAGEREIIRARTHFATVPLPEKAFSFRAYKNDDVRHALEALFHGKCAYCESRYEISGPVDIEHFRPKAGVDGAPTHQGYWWLAAHWANLLPSCLDCNRRRYQPTPEEFASLSGVLDRRRSRGFRLIKTGKETSFPVAGVRMLAEPAVAMLEAGLVDEEPLLIDPCSEDPGTHLSFHIDRDSPLGLVFAAPTIPNVPAVLPQLSQKVEEIELAARQAGVSVRGAISIQVYGLNRLALVQERTRLLRRLEMLAGVIIDVSAAADAVEALDLAEPAQEAGRAQAVAQLRAVVERTFAEIRSMAQPDAPFSTMVSSWIEQFRTDMAEAAAIGGE